MKNQTAHEQDLLKQHAPLVSTMARQFAHSMPHFFSADHLHGLGLIALLEAARHYPPASGISFETFARVQIHTTLHGEIRRAKNWLNLAPATAASTPAFA